MAASRKRLNRPASTEENASPKVQRLSQARAIQPRPRLTARAKKSRYTEAYLAVSRGDASAIDSLCADELGLNHRYVDYDSKTLAHVAVEYSHLSVVKALIAKGANLTLKDKFGKSAVSYAIEMNHYPIILTFYRAGLISQKWFVDYSQKNKIQGCKDAQQFEAHAILTKEHTAALFSHSISKVRKSVGINTASLKYHHFWFKKQQPNYELVQIEVFGQELFRLFMPHQPKTRWAIDSEGMTYVLSKEVNGYQCLRDMQNSGVPVELINNQFLDPEDTSQTPQYTNLGHVLVNALLVNEVDLKRGNLGLDEQRRLVKIDGDLTFYALMRQLEGNDLEKFAITERLIRELPSPGHYRAINWLDWIMNRCFRENPEFTMSGSARSFRREINEAILKILLLPHGLLERLANHHMNQKLSKVCVHEICLRANKFRLEAFSNASFLDYMMSDDAITLKQQFIEDLKRFKMTRKHQLVEADDGAMDSIAQQFEALRDKAIEAKKELALQHDDVLEDGRLPEMPVVGSSTDSVAQHWFMRL